MRKTVSKTKDSDSEDFNVKKSLVSQKSSHTEKSLVTQKQSHPLISVINERIPTAIPLKKPEVDPELENLAAIAVPNFLNAQVRAKIAKVGGEFRSIGTALEAYNLDRNGYPPYPGWGEHTNSRYFNALSTPVAYISSPDSIYDPFRKKHVADNDGVEKPRYGYFDPRTSPVRWFIVPSSYQGIKLPGNYRYTLISIGPSHVQHVDGGTPSGFIVYDSTNGVNSWGNIYRFGPRSISLPPVKTVPTLISL